MIKDESGVGAGTRTLMKRRDAIDREALDGNPQGRKELEE